MENLKDIYIEPRTGNADFVAAMNDFYNSIIETNVWSSKYLSLYLVKKTVPGLIVILNFRKGQLVQKLELCSLQSVEEKLVKDWTLLIIMHVLSSA